MKIYITLGQAYAFIWQNNKKDFLFNGNHENNNTDLMQLFTKVRL